MLIILQCCITIDNTPSLSGCDCLCRFTIFFQLVQLPVGQLHKLPTKHTSDETEDEMVSIGQAWKLYRVIEQESASRKSQN